MRGGTGLSPEADERTHQKYLSNWIGEQIEDFLYLSLKHHFVEYALEVSLADTKLLHPQGNHGGCRERGLEIAQEIVGDDVRGR